MRVKLFRGGTPRMAAALLGVLVVAGCAAGPKDPASSHETIPAAANAMNPDVLALPETAYETGHYDEALRLYRQILASDSNDAEVKLGIADTQLAAGNLGVAAQLYDELETNPRLHARVLQGRGIALLKLGRRDRAEKLLKDAVQADATLWRAWNALGALYDSDRDWAEADEAYRKALQQVPHSPTVLNNLGFSQLSQGKTVEAISTLQTALQLDPSLAPAQMNLRIALALAGRYDDAMAGVRGPNSAATLNDVGYAAMTRGDFAKAGTLFTQALNASSTYNDVASKNLAELKVIAGKGTGRDDVQ